MHRSIIRITMGRRKLRWVMAAAMAAAVFGVVGVQAFADPMVFDRGLPTTNLNNVSGANRSNVSWSNDNTYVSGDDFTIGSSGETWIVTGIRTWNVSKGVPGGPPFYLGDQYSDVSLYTGTSGLSLAATGTLTTGSNANSNANITHTPVTYVGAINYQTTGGAFRQMYQNDFTLNLSIAGGVKYYFAVDGTPRNPSTDYWFNHASNAALSGSTQQGADDRWLVWPKSGLTGAPVQCNSNGPFAGVCDGGWDKSSDINVQVFAHKFVNPTATFTPVPPTATSTPVPPTATATPIGTPQAVGGITDFESGGPAAVNGAPTAQSGESVSRTMFSLSIGMVMAVAMIGWYVRRRRQGPR